MCYYSLTSESLMILAHTFLLYGLQVHNWHGKHDLKCLNPTSLNRLSYVEHRLVHVNHVVLKCLGKHVICRFWGKDYHLLLFLPRSGVLNDRVYETYDSGSSSLQILFVKIFRQIKQVTTYHLAVNNIPSWMSVRWNCNFLQTFQKAMWLLSGITFLQ